MSAKNSWHIQLQEWDGRRPAIQYMLRDCRRYLIQEKLDGMNAQKRSNSNCNYCTEPTTIGWIERLLQTPIADHRKYCMWRILATYLVNVSRLSDEEALSIVMTWLDRCNAVKRLSFYPRYRANDVIRNARRKGFYPISLNNLQTENAELYNDLIQQQQEVIS